MRLLRGRLLFLNVSSLFSISLGSWLDLAVLPFMFITVARNEECNGLICIINTVNLSKYLWNNKKLTYEHGK